MQFQQWLWHMSLVNLELGWSIKIFSNRDTSLGLFTLTSDRYVYDLEHENYVSPSIEDSSL